MTTPLTPRRRSRASGEEPVTGTGSDPAGRIAHDAAREPDGGDALAALRLAATGLEPAAFAACFSPGGWLRVPRPEGDVVLTGRTEIERAGHQLHEILTGLTWTPSQRFVAAGQVVEEAVARAQMVPPAGPAETPTESLRVPMRVVAALEGDGAIGGLTLWVDWAALRDPLGVRSARGAASALVAQARARDARGLQVIRSEPGAAPLPPAPRQPVERGRRPPVPAAPVLWWRRHRRTLAGTAMALTTAGVIAWVGIGVLRAADEPAANLSGAAAPASPGASGRPGADGNGAGAGAGTGDGSRGATGAATGGPSPTSWLPASGALPPVRKEPPTTRPTVQAGTPYDLKSDLLFRTGSTDLTPTALTEIRKVADRVRAADVSGNIQVNGYTDDVGTRSDNADLSRRRARVVANLLARQLRGLPVQLTPQGFGEDAAVATNTTPAGRAKNRHVTVVLPRPGTSSTG